LPKTAGVADDEQVVDSRHPDDPDAPKAGDGADKGKPKEEPTVSKKEYDALKKQNEELAESERYWAGQAKARPKPETDDTDDEPDQQDDAAGKPDITDDDTPEKFTDELSTKGMQALIKRGVLTRKEAESLFRKVAAEEAEKVVGRAVRHLSTDAQMVREYPDLNDAKSPLFKKTGEVFQEMVAEDPALKKSPAALKLAARTAKLQLDLESRQNGHETRDRDTDDDREQSRDRQRRIDAQNGDRGRGARSDIEDEDPGLSPMQRKFLGQMKVSEEDFSKSKKELGVQTNGNGRRR